MNRKEATLRGARSALALGVSMLSVAGALAQSTTQAEATPTRQERTAALKASLAAGTAIPESIGDLADDLVYTPITPCRIVDTRVAGGGLTPNTTKQFDVDGTSFSGQGGSSSGCGIPNNVAYAVAMTITSVAPAAAGYITAYGYSGPKPNSSSINFVAGQIVANTTIVPVLPGGGNDFSVVSNTSTNVVIDVVGYFARPVATALDCVNVFSASTTVPNNSYTAVDAACTLPYTVTGGGSYPVEGTLGRPNIWTDGSVSGNSWRTWVDNQTGANRNVQSYARCCRIPGR